MRMKTVLSLTTKFTQLSNSAVIQLRKMSTCSASLIRNDPSEVIMERNGSALIVKFNRPQALNAFNHNIALRLKDKLTEVANDESVKLVILKGEGDKAFCAGGDLRELCQTAKADFKGPHACQLLRDEYFTQYTINTFRVPIVSLADGYVMGAGCGLAVNSKYCVATERTIMSMPETIIGFFPDNGGSYFLSHLRGELGTYLGLTCTQLKGEEAYNSSLATHYVTSKDGSLDSLESDLLNDPHPTHESVKKILDYYHFKCFIGAKSELLGNKEKIGKIFSQCRMEDIISMLREDNSRWSQQTLSILLTMSPTALKITLKLLHEARALSLYECLKMELRLGRGILQEPASDFFRGVDAKIVYKTNKPCWNPASLEQVDDNFIEEFFRPMTDFNLTEFNPEAPLTEFNSEVPLSRL